MRLRRRREESGFTVIELGVAGLLGVAVVGLAATVLIVVTRAGNFTQGQGFTLNDARNAMQQMEKEFRGADFVNWCATDGTCVEVGAQTAAGGFRTVRYLHASESLNRSLLDPDTGTWSDAQPVIERLVNGTDRPVFSCDSGTTLARLTIDLWIMPTPQSNPSLNLQTSIRPRNFPERASCP
jgi:type II secretory pathway component PulJ